MKSSLLTAISLMTLGISSSAFAQTPPARTAQVSLATLTANQKVDGFTTLCVYTGDAGKPMGARFQHTRTGFIFDYLQIESVPQAFMYANTPPTSDKGEPHTQEHLLLGKGNRGRAVASAETMTLSHSSAYTMQWRTCYFFNTTAGAPVFYNQLEMRLDALLHPNYTDEEVRREVRNFGITNNADGTLRLEEKGSVYNEMVSTMDKSGSQLYRALYAAVYGANHPLAYEAGGTPEALRTLTPDEIRAFRNNDYYLGNMGMVASFARTESLHSVLSSVNSVLNRLQPGPNRANQPPVIVPKFPKPKPAPAGAVRLVSYPDTNAEQPGDIAFAWPATRELSVTDSLLMGMFLDNLASDADTPLYKRFIDAKTRTVDSGATSVYSWSPDELGHPIYLGLSSVKPSFVTEANILKVRQIVLDEIKRIAALPDGSPELLAFNAKLRTRMVASQRGLSKFVNSPPGFGERFSTSGWMDACRQLEGVPGFRKSILLTPQFAAIDKRLSGKTNLWRTLLPQWQITGVTPYAVGVKPDTALVAKQQTERTTRIDAEVARLKTVYGTTDDQETIRRYKADYDAETARQDAIAKKMSATTHFLKNPPLTLDGSLQYKESKITHDIPLFAANFETMTSATTSLFLRMDGVSQDELVYLPALPTLMDSVGIIENGKPLSYETTLQKQRKEILSAGCSFSTNPRAGRYELVVSGSGNNTEEAKRSLLWMKRFMTAPNWERENLPRLRDLVDQMLDQSRNQMQGQEEFWVSAVGSGWRYQNDPMALTTGCFLTQTHDLQRLRWMLKAAPTPADKNAFLAYLTTLGSNAKNVSNRAELETLLKAMGGDATAKGQLSASLTASADAFVALPSGAQALARDANADLARTLSDLPGDSYAADWAYLCAQMRSDFTQGPDETLKQLNALRQRLLRTGNARIVQVGASSTEAKLRPELETLISTLTVVPASRSLPKIKKPYVTARLQERVPDARPVFVGLVAPSMKGGTIMNNAPTASYQNFSDDSLLRVLAGNLYGGGGANSVFMKTWGAGLAYGNGIGSSLPDGRVSYYADHTPEIPQTLRFVIDTVKNAPPDPNLVEYALANVFGSQESGGYESRAFAMANQKVDGTTPERVRTFRSSLLALRNRPDLTTAVYQKLPEVMTTILPGYTGSLATVPNAFYVVIGPEKQLSAYENYLKTLDGDKPSLYRLYPRDFWIPAPVVP